MKMEREKITCEVCKIDLSSSKILEDHLKGKKHMKLAKEQKMRNDKIARGVFIRGSSSIMTKEDILKYFGRYGAIANTHFGPKGNFVIIDYVNASSAEEVLKKNVHIIKGRKLFAEKRQIKAHTLEHYLDKEEEFESVIESLKALPNFGAQLEKLCRTLQPNPKEMSRRCDFLCRELASHLREIFPACQVYPFGSTTNGLCFKKSDIDVYVSNVKHSEEDEVRCLKTARNYLGKFQQFKNVIAIANAKIPILKFYHPSTRLNCDVNFRNILGVCNSHLIAYYLSLDEKLKPCMIALKFWGKVHQTTGKNHLFSNYSLALMFIFFLQQEPYKLPIVKSLQGEGAKFEHIWNGEFQPAAFSSQELAKVSAIKLLSEFFNFYARFDYANDIICPYLGKPLSKSFFKSLETIPEEFVLYRKNYETIEMLKVDKPICIQDPFEHTRNTCTGILQATLDLFVAFCKMGTGMISGEEQDALYRLFSTKAEIPKTITSTKDSIKLSLEMCKCPYLKDQTPLEWFSLVEDFVLKVIREVLKGEVRDETDLVGDSKRSKVGEQKDVHDQEATQNSTYFCTCTVNTWSCRKAKSVDINQVLEREIAITEKLLSQYKGFPQEPLIKFQVILELHQEPKEITILLVKKYSYKKTFAAFAAFFSSNFLNWFSSYEKDLNTKIQI